LPKLKRSEIRKLDSIFEMEGGYCLDFSDRTMAEFFEDELGIQIDQEKYSLNGHSKAKRLRFFIEIEDGVNVSTLLTKLILYKIALPKFQAVNLEHEKEWVIELARSVSTDVPNIATEKLSEKAKTLNLDTVSRDLDRALKSSKDDPESALTSACSTLESVCRSLLVEMNLELPNSKDLKSLYKAVREPLGLTPSKSSFSDDIAHDVLTILGGLTTVVEGIGALRTHAGDAHGREKGYKRVDSRIASLAVHASSSLSLFLIETWQKKFPNKQLHEH
jgi:hypothetical protein